MAPGGKRQSQSRPQNVSKKRKLVGNPNSKLKVRGIKKDSTAKTVKARDRGIIPIPTNIDQDEGISDQDMDIITQYGGATSFLQRLDENSIARSKKETDRLHQLNKPKREERKPDDLPSLDSHSEDDEPWSSGISENEAVGVPEESGQTSSSSNSLQSTPDDFDSDVEMPYETAPRKQRSSWESKDPGIQRLPIKLADGRVQNIGSKNVPKPEETDEEESDDSDDEQPDEKEVNDVRVEDGSTGARFGRPAIADVLSIKSRKAKVQEAKEQIASLCQEILAEPESSLGLLRRLHSFSLAKLSTPTHPEPVPNDSIIRKLAILSELAVFKDIIPGYRVRALSEKEKTEKVSQTVARTRDWEQGLVSVYQNYLRALEAEVKAKSELCELALQCMCTLAVEVTHFNFRENLLTCIVARLSKKSWDESSDLCLRSLSQIFRGDLTGIASLEVVRLLNRMIKEKRYQVHPNVLSCLLHLRLRTELGVRASETRADKEEKLPAGKAAARRAKGKPTDQPHLSKKAKKALKEKKEIEREFRDAEAEVDKEERAATQTETLKLLFVLYFSIIKNPRPTPLLPAALSGISRFAHLVNVDFFKDLLKVLKEIILTEPGEESEETTPGSGVPDERRRTHQKLLCIVTAFDLLSGQGEALDIDLSDFISRLYAIIQPLSLLPNIDDPSEIAPDSNSTTDSRSMIDMLFRALDVIFSPRSFGSAAPPWRSAAFAKRLLGAALHWPPKPASRAIEFVAGLVAKDAKLEALLSTEDRTFDGIYRPDVEDPQLCNPFASSFYELFSLKRDHIDPNVREEADKLINYTRS